MTKRTGSARSNQTGNVMLSVMVISAILMGIGATLYNNYIVSEAEAVEKSLVDMRVYWAMIGNANLLFGRVSGQGLPCNSSGNPLDVSDLATNANSAGPTSPTYTCTSDGPASAPTSSTNEHRVGSLQYYFDGPSQFNDGNNGPARGISTPGVKIWSYPVETFVSGGSNYTLSIDSVVSRLQNLSFTPPSYQPNDGRFRVDMSVISSGDVPVLGDLVSRSPRLTVGFCVVDQIRSPYTAPSDLAANGCGAITSKSREGYNQIEFLQWNMAIP